MSSYDSHIIHSGKPVHSDTTLERHQNSVLTILPDTNIESRMRYQHSAGNSTWHFQNLSIARSVPRKILFYAKRLGFCNSLCEGMVKERQKGPFPWQFGNRIWRQFCHNATSWTQNTGMTEDASSKLSHQSASKRGEECLSFSRCKGNTHKSSVTHCPHTREWAVIAISESANNYFLQ